MTTVLIPAPIEAPEQPEGDPGAAMTLASTLLHASAGISEFAEEAATLSTPGALWLGSASDAYADHAQRAARDHDPMGDTLGRVARGVDVFAEELGSLQTLHATVLAQITSYHRERAALTADVAAATESDAPALQQRAHSLAALRVEIVDVIADLERRTCENEDYLVRLFTGADTATEARSASGGVDAAMLAAVLTGFGLVAKSPKDTARWWKGLSETEQNALIAAYPDRIGRADGLPATARDRANRLLLDADLAELEQKEENGLLSADEKTRLENVRKTQEALRTADDYAMPGTGERPGGQLWLYDPGAFDGDGRVAIAVGDLDSAEDVSLQVPGIRTEMADAPGGVREATNLYESARYNGDGSSVATMFWLGYDTPAGDPLEWLEVPSESYAEDGGHRFATAVDGLRASRAHDPAHMTAIGHSYGSTAVSHAAADHDLAVDDVALIGSPGAGPADHASDFSVGADHVFDGRNSHDPVAFVGDEGWARKDQLFGAGLGRDPSSEEFGARRFEAEAVDRQSWPGTDRHIDDHSKYYTRDSESLYNLGRIVDGQSGSINVAEHSYDPWWRAAVDPEKDRTPTSDIPGRSDTGVG